MINFFKGIVTGLGAIAPGLSGSVLLVLFGLYQKTIHAISRFFKHWKENIKFLLPLGSGILLGILLFSKLIAYLLANFEMPTRFAFFGLIWGTVPLFFREVKKQGFSPKYYFYIAIGLAAGLFLFLFHANLFPAVSNPGIGQSVLLGVVVAAAYIVPGMDSAAVLSALGLYEVWINALANLRFAILLPAAVGVLLGAFGISFLLQHCLTKHYTATFSVIFGFFLSVIPSVLSKTCVLGGNFKTALSLFLFVISFVLSLLFGNMEADKQAICN